MCVKACYVSFAILSINCIFLISAQDEIPLSAEKEQKYILPLLGYIDGYKIGQNIAINFLPFILSPIVIVPIMNEQQGIHTRKSATEEKDQENNLNFQDIVPTEVIITENNNTVDEDLQLPSKVDYNTEIYNLNDNLSSEDDTFKQADSNGTNSSNSQSKEISESNGSLETPQSSEEVNEDANIKTANITTTPLGPYPNAIYNNSDEINKLPITVPPFQNNLALPNAENKWENFSLPSVKNSENITRESDFNETKSTINNVLYFPTTSSPIDKYNIYPPRQYYQNIDSLSITTNSYTNVEHHLPPAYDDRWQRFSSLQKSYLTSGFRPLAGLYYDGFLHKTLNKQTGFQPNQNYNYYNNI